MSSARQGLLLLAVAAIAALALGTGHRGPKGGGGGGRGGGGGGRGGRGPCPVDEREFMPGATLRDDGSAWDPETSTLFPKGNFWSEPDPKTNATNFFGCPCKLARPCLRKCCQMGMAMDSNMACVRRANASLGDGGKWFNPVLSERHGEDIISVNGNSFRLGLLTDKPCLPRGGRGSRLLNENQSYIRASDANLCVIGEVKEGCVNFTQFCHDFVEDRGDYQSVLCPPSKAKKKGWGGITFRHTKQENFVVNVLKYFTQTVSSIALLFMVMLYAAAPELRSLHGKCHMSHAISLLIYYTLENVLMYGSNALRLLKGVCLILGPGEIYFYLAPLSWLNVMSIDIMLAFLCLRPIMPGGRHEDIRKFILYSLYAWGIPALILVITIIKDFTKEKDLQPTFDDYCEVGTFRQWSFRKYPMYTLLTINGIIFGLTAFKIYSLKQDTSKSMGHDSRRHCRDGDNGSARTKMYFKLLLLMGFHWVLEPLTKILHTPLRLDERWYLRIIWYLFALVNRLQGVFILIMFMGNAKLTGSVWRKLFNSRLWANITSKIIEVSSSTNKTSSGIELEEGSSGSKGATSSKRGSAATFVDMGEFSPDPREHRSPSIATGEIATISKVVENRGRKWSTETCTTPDIDMEEFSFSPDHSPRKRKDSCVSFNLKEEKAIGLSLKEGIAEEEEETAKESTSPQEDFSREQNDASDPSQQKDDQCASKSDEFNISAIPRDQKKDDAVRISMEKKDDKSETSCLENDTECLVNS